MTPFGLRILNGERHEAVKSSLVRAKSRVSQIEWGRVSTREVLDRHAEALGGRLSLMADFGDELLPVG
jgi:hypothetical protein